MKSQDVEKALKRLPRPAVKVSDLLSMGSTPLNLACSGYASGGLPKGTYALFVGQSSAGKTWVAKTVLAELSINPLFADYRIIFDNPENGSYMNDRRFFGKGMAGRMEPPAGTKESPIHSATVEDFYFNVDDAIKDGRPFIYVLDSMDAIDTMADKDHFQKRKNARGSQKEVAGSYGTSKARLNGMIRLVGNALPKSGSILIVIAQAKENIGFDAKFNPLTRSGGTALKFYAHLEVWFSVKKHVKKKYRDKDWEQGVIVKAKVAKSRLHGRVRTVEFPILHSAGIDDTGGCVDFLLEHGHWKKTGAGIKAAEFSEAPLGRESLVELIETTDRTNELRQLVGKVWDEIERAVAVNRRNKYE
jgi:RecA/RadA recombinase